MSRNFILPVGRASYTFLLKPKPDNKGNLKYSTDILWPKNTDLSGLKKVIEQTAKDKWGVKAPKNIFNCIKDGDGIRPNSGEPYSPEYHGHYFVTIKNSQKPGVVDSQMQPIISESEVYGGCYIRASVLPWAYEVDGSKGVTLYLKNVQKVREGDRFGGALANPEDEFEVIDDEMDNPDNYQSSNLLG